MTWREAFLAQARSDFEVMEKLKSLGMADCHWLHYLQMCTEKLAKAMMTPAASIDPPTATHVTFVKALRVLKKHAVLRRSLGYADRAAFQRFIESLLDTARKIEALAPAIAGFSMPNPEYPWKDPGTGDLIYPAAFVFAEFRPPKNAQLQKIEQLVRKLLQVLN
jgi:hypothetical protein